MNENKKRANSFLIQFILCKLLCFRPQLTLILALFCHFRRYFLFEATIFTKKRRTRAVYITPLSLTSNHRMKRMIRLLQLVLLHWRTFSCPIIWSFMLSYRIILQIYRHDIHNTIQCVYISQRSLWIVRVSHDYYFINKLFVKSLRTIPNFFGRTTILLLLLVRPL